MEIKEDNISVLKLKNIYVDNFDFKRKSLSLKETTPSISLSKSIDAVGYDYAVTLSISITVKDIYTLNLSMVGIFNIDDTELSKSSLLEKNAVAILFPYLRSQITLLTSQPAMSPIILPTININTLFEHNNDH